MTTVAQKGQSDKLRTVTTSPPPSNVITLPPDMTTQRRQWLADLRKGKHPGEATKEIWDGNQELASQLLGVFEREGLNGLQTIWPQMVNNHPILKELTTEPRIKITSLQEVLTRPDPKWLFEKLIQEKGYTLLYGYRGSFKSFWALHIAMCLALAGRKVLYLATEGQMKRRIQAYAKHHECELPYDSLKLIEQPILLNEDAQKALLVEAINAAQFKPDLLIVDTLIKNSSGKENDNSDAAVFHRACHSLRDEFNMAVLLIHHTGKAQDDSRGASAWEGDPDVVLKITDDDSFISLKNTKNRDEEEQPTQHFRPRIIEVGRDEKDEPITSCVLLPHTGVIDVKGQPLTRMQREVLEFLALDIFKETGAKRAVLKEETKIRSLDNVLTTLKRLGCLVQGTKGDPYTITEEGLNALKQ